MRFLGAVVVILACFVLLAIAANKVLAVNLPAWVTGVGAAVVLLALSQLIGWLFGFHGRAFTRGPTLEQLEAQGLLVSMDFKAKRAFQVEEFEDEGPTYFLELADGSVLFLNGQYLYDYELITDDPEVNQPRSFPNTEFTVRRHRQKNYVADIICRGTTLEPEVSVSPFTTKEFKSGKVPGDGQIITDRSYAEIKAELLSRRKR